MSFGKNLAKRSFCNHILDTMRFFYSLFFLLLGSSFCAAQFVVFGSARQSEIDTGSFRLDYGTNTSGNAVVRYGKTTSFELGVQAGTSPQGFAHSVELLGLNAAEFYYVRLGMYNGSDTAWGSTGYYSTASVSTGQVRVFFNKGVYAPIAFAGNQPDISNSGNLILNELISYIDNAQTSIDIAAYNINRTAIVDALNRAVARGVQVRYVANDGTSNTALASPNTPNFPIIYVNPLAFMHNKFLSIDADDVNNSWVWMGSMNFTNNDIDNDANNVLAIQDQALAKAYRIEFQEMWGSDGPSPNSAASRAGSQKTDNTPHNFNIGGEEYELYFSPSDQTNSKMLAALESADRNIFFALLTFTRADLGQAIIDAHNNGLDVRGIIQNTGDQSSRYPVFQGEGLNVEANSSGVVHHKYGIVDANSSLDPLVITGSHNWSNAAENSNDENTLIIHSANMANLFLQEFSRRWCDVQGGSCSFVVSTQSIPALLPSMALSPNPISQGQAAELQLGRILEQKARLRCVDMQGRTIHEEQLVPGSSSYRLPALSLPSGQYYWVLEGKEQAQSLPWIQR